VDETETGPDRDPIDLRRVLILGLWTTALAVAFTALLIGDTVTASSLN
jgi:hypothetical protein